MLSTSNYYYYYYYYDYDYYYYYYDYYLYPNCSVVRLYPMYVWDVLYQQMKQVYST